MKHLRIHNFLKKKSNFPFFIFYSPFVLFSIIFLCNACNKGEGLGGSSSLEGYVYEIEHLDDNYSFQTHIFPSLDADVFIEFGDDASIGERVRTGREGYYRFDYLRKGNYTVYALSKSIGEQKKVVSKNVKVSGNLNKADTIFIHTGDAVETAIIKGMVWVKYYNKGRLVSIDGQDSIPAVENRVYIKYEGEDTHFDDVRVGDKGIFVFQKIHPDKLYEVYVNTEIPGEEHKNILFPIYKKIEVRDPYRIYPLENEERLEFTIILNN
ncbi:MAG: hypothetical protein LBP83_01505 [Dysgonamonadaceae bacterium]|jgi:hypothetical protein|nr:hypothetical protein [Dysgonamonadaceae bacterium]